MSSRSGRSPSAPTWPVGRRCSFFQAEDGIRDLTVTGVQTCALPISFDAAGETVGAIHARQRAQPVAQQRPFAAFPGEAVVVVRFTVVRQHTDARALFVRDRKSVVEGKSVDLGGRRIIKKKKA